MRLTRTCLRCGQPLPELTRERLRKGYERKLAEDRERQENRDRAYCRKCEYYGSESYGGNLCDYMLRTGHRRGCKAGVGCERRVIA